MIIVMRSCSFNLGRLTYALETNSFRYLNLSNIITINRNTETQSRNTSEIPLDFIYFYAALCISSLVHIIVLPSKERLTL